MNNKVYVLAPREDWILDRFAKEWNEDNADISVSDPKQADVLWLMADFCWKQLHAPLLYNKKIITTIHHITPEKFNGPERMDFQLRDDITDVYHVPNQRTYDFIRPLTNKLITLIPYWANQNIWKVSDFSKTDLRNKYTLPEKSYLIGSFQRDSEGAGISKGIFLPKLEKGPDLLADAIISYRDRCVNYFPVHVVLAGWRRQYVISRLESEKIPYSYFELPSQETLCELYQTIDLYPVTSRHEGGPQSLIECGLLNVPVVSRPVGIAEQVLPLKSISDNVCDAAPTVPNVEKWKLPAGYEEYRKLIQSL